MIQELRLYLALTGAAVISSKLSELVAAKKSRVILALDAVDERPARVVEEVEEFVVGVKVGLPLVLKWGLEEVEYLLDRFRGSLYMLCDFKLADVPPIVVDELKLIKRMGFDGAIIHLFQGGIEEVASAQERPELFGLVAMTHGGSVLIDQHFRELVETALRAGLEGCVVPATKPHIIKAVRELAPDKLLLSPGVGAQGAPFGSAIRAGADFEIVGRAITASADRRSSAKAARDATYML
ncbi:MAG: orotidine 5'-phosphate decarboxylase / HUMPS family protein [Thermofilaceae archaeon]